MAFSDLVIFGDSLSDTGNHPAALIGLIPPYYENRISNGPVAVDVLAGKLELSAAHSGYLFNNGSGNNYAVSGGNAFGTEPQDLEAQLSAYLNVAPINLSEDTLYVVMIGGNDIRDAAAIRNLGQGQTAARAAANAVKLAVERLVARGARALLVSNVPDISKIPETTDRSSDNPGIVSRAQQLSIEFNTRLAQHLDSIEVVSNLEILEYDFYTHFNQLLNQPSLNGFTNTTEACFNNSPFSFHPQCDFEKFVFFDNIHPSAKTHKLIGNALFTLATQSTSKKLVPISAIISLILE